MQLDLRGQRELARDEIGVRVPREQRRLEEYEARCPDGGRPPEPREDLLRDDRLDQEQQERAEKLTLRVLEIAAKVAVALI